MRNRLSRFIGEYDNSQSGLESVYPDFLRCYCEESFYCFNELVPIWWVVKVNLEDCLKESIEEYHE